MAGRAAARFQEGGPMTAGWNYGSQTATEGVGLAVCRNGGPVVGCLCAGS